MKNIIAEIANSKKKCIGAIMVALLFSGIIIAMSTVVGLLPALIIWGISIFSSAFVFVAAYLISS